MGVPIYLDKELYYSLLYVSRLSFDISDRIIYFTLTFLKEKIPFSRLYIYLAKLYARILPLWTTLVEICSFHCHEIKY